MGGMVFTHQLEQAHGIAPNNVQQRLIAWRCHMQIHVPSFKACFLWSPQIISCESEKQFTARHARKYMFLSRCKLLSAFTHDASTPTSLISYITQLHMDKTACLKPHYQCNFTCAWVANTAASTEMCSEMTCRVFNIWNRCSKRTIYMTALHLVSHWRNMDASGAVRHICPRFLFFMFVRSVSVTLSTILLWISTN